MALPNLLSRQEAAERARVTLPTFNKLIRNGRGPSLTAIGGKTFVTDAEFTRWISAQTQRPQAAYSIGTGYTAEFLLRNDAA